MRATDQEIVARLCDGSDPGAFSLAVSRYGDMVYSTCWRMLRNEAQAADITQETFFQLFKSARKIQGCLGGWLHRVATYRCLDLIRKEGARRRREEKWAGQTALNGNAWAEVEPLVDEALNSLPEEIHEVLAMHFLEQKTTIQIAAHMGVSQPTISRRLNEGLKQVREHLRRSGVVVGVIPLQTILIHGAQFAPEVLLQKLGKMALTHAASTETVGAVGSAGCGSAASAGGLVGKLGVGIGAVAALFVSAIFLLPSPTPAPVAPQAPLKIPDASLTPVLAAESEAVIAQVAQPASGSESIVEVQSAAATRSTSRPEAPSRRQEPVQPSSSVPSAEKPEISATPVPPQVPTAAVRSRTRVPMYSSSQAPTVYSAVSLSRYLTPQESSGSFHTFVRRQSGIVLSNSPARTPKADPVRQRTTVLPRPLKPKDTQPTGMKPPPGGGR